MKFWKYTNYPSLLQTQEFVELINSFTFNNGFFLILSMYNTTIALSYILCDKNIPK